MQTYIDDNIFSYILAKYVKKEVTEIRDMSSTAIIFKFFPPDCIRNLDINRKSVILQLFLLSRRQPVSDFEKKRS